MFIKRLTVLQFLSLALAGLVPQFEVPLFSELSVLSLPGVNITNGDIVSTLNVVKNSYIVVLKDDIISTTISLFLEQVSKRIGKGLGHKYSVNPVQPWQKGFQAFQVTTDRKGLADIAKSPLVAYIELDSFASVTPTSFKLGNTSLLVSTLPIGAEASVLQRPGGGDNTWGLARISHKKPGSNNYVYNTVACKGIVIYVLDTGIRTTHEQFRGDTVSKRRAVHGANFITGQPIDDENGHGTHCAGIAAGWTTGVCQQATVINVKVLGKDGRGSYSGIIAGLQWALDDAITKKVQYRAAISMSLGGSFSSSLNAAVQAVANKGIPVIVAAGNDNKNVINTSPGSSQSAITVAAVDISDTRGGFSNYGSTVDVFAPGVNIYSAWASSDKDYAWFDGTSQATPYVAGLAAYYMATETVTGAQAVKDRIISAAGKNMLKDVMGSPNRIAYNNNGL